MRMYSHLQTLIDAGAERRMLGMFLREEPQILEAYPELEKSLQAIHLLQEEVLKHPWTLFNLYYLHHRGAEKTKNGYWGRYDSEGRARYMLDGNEIHFFNNGWFERHISPFEVVKEIITDRHAKIKIGTLQNQIVLRRERIDETLYWPPFCQEEKNRHSWVATKLMNSLKVPSCICPTCGHGKGEMVWVRSSLRLLGCVWGTGEECIGDGYVIIRVVREDTGEPFVY